MKIIFLGNVDYGSPGGPQSDFVFIFHFSIFPKWRSENHYVAPLRLRRLTEFSAEEVGLKLLVFLRKLLDTDMPCD